MTEVPFMGPAALTGNATTTIGATEFHEAVTEAEYAAANATPRG